MIIEPDFPDHWKTRMLIGLTNDESSPMMVIRLWAHCHLRKTDSLPSDLEVLKAVCRWSGEALNLRDTLVQCGFIEVLEDHTLVAHDWADTNKSLVKNWKNGLKNRVKVLPKPTQEGSKPIPKDTQKGSKGGAIDRVDRVDRVDGVDGQTKRKQKKQVIPKDVNEVLEYQKTRGKGKVVDCTAFFDFYQSNNWCDSRGNAVMNWKQKYLTSERQGYFEPNKAARNTEMDFSWVNPPPDWRKLLLPAFPDATDQQLTEFSDGSWADLPATIRDDIIKIANAT